MVVRGIPSCRQTSETFPWLATSESWIARRVTSSSDAVPESSRVRALSSIGPGTPGIPDTPVTAGARDAAGSGNGGDGGDGRIGDADVGTTGRGRARKFAVIG